MNQNNNVRTV